MSSIYKKGRDGYYYYQTYIFNPESKKKDKRVFHALRTKDSVAAKLKQRELDKKYENQSDNDSNLKKFPYNFNSSLAIVVVVTVATILIINFFRTNRIKQNSTLSTTSKEVTYGLENKINFDSIDRPVNPVVENQVDSTTENILKSLKVNIEPKLVKPEVIIPKHTVIRVERLSDAFEQGKVYVIIDKPSTDESQRLLCEELVERYSEFSNFIICLYANNRAGKDLAKGNDEAVSVEEKKQSWLAMYTYNPVEGEYFDDNPSRYLSAY